MQRLRIALIGLIVVLAACVPASQPSGGQAPPPQTEQRAVNQTLRIAQVGLPASMSPEASAFNIPIYWLMYDNLVAFDSKFNLVPWAAERWELVNPTTWRLYLRKDLTFSNGDKLTAADVEYSGKAIVERKMPQTAQIPSLQDVRAVDDYTVDVISKVPDVTTVVGMPWLWIMPKAYSQRVGPEAFAAKPIGSGPYELAEYRSGDFGQFKLRSTPHPFRKVVATTVEVRSLPQMTSVVAGFQTGDVDMMLGQLTGDQVNALKRTGAVLNSRLISNLGVLIPMREMQQRTSPLQDKRVRQALNYAVNKEAIAQKLYNGEAQPVGQLGLPSIPFWEPDVKPYPYDTAKAKQLLAEAGYPNGLTLPNGFDFTPQTASPDFIQAIQSDLRDAGVTVQAQSWELGVFLDKFYSRNGQSKGDLFAVSLPDPNGLWTAGRGHLSCDKPPENIWWCDPEFDKLMAQASQEPDYAKRSATLKQATRLNTQNVSHIYGLLLPLFVVTSTKVRGFDWASDIFSNFDSTYLVQ